MGKFGEINYGMPVPDSGMGALGQGLKQAAGAVAEVDQALTVYQQGVLKNQALQASTLLGKSLFQTNQFIKQTPYMPRDEVRKAFSGKAWEDLPSELREEVEAPVDNPDDPGIAMWKLAPHIFRKASEEATDAAAQMIKAPGWQNEFRTGAIGEVAAFQGKMMEHQFENFRQDSRLTEGNAFKEAVNAQRWDYANYIAGKMQFHSPAEREQLKGVVELEKARAPLNAAMLSTSPAEVSLALADLKAHPENYAGLPIKDQQIYATQLMAHQRELATWDEKARAAAVTQNGKLAWDQLLKAEQDGRPLHMGMAGRPGEALDPEGIKQRMEYIRRVQRGENITTNPAVQKALMDQWASKPEDFAKEDLTRYRLHLSNADYEYLLKGQKDLRIKGGEETKSSQIKAIQQAKTDVITSAFGLDPKDEKDLPRIHQLEFMVDQGVKAFRANNGGREPNYAEAVGIADAAIGGKGGWTSKTGTEAMMKKPLPGRGRAHPEDHRRGSLPHPGGAGRRDREVRPRRPGDRREVGALGSWRRPHGRRADGRLPADDRPGQQGADRRAPRRQRAERSPRQGRLQFIISQLASPASRITADTTSQTEAFEREAEAVRADAAVGGAAIAKGKKIAQDRAEAIAEKAARDARDREMLPLRREELLAEVEEYRAQVAGATIPGATESPRLVGRKADLKWREEELARIEKRLAELAGGE